ncbi:MAG TPA: DUF6350 family protein [Pilimelia sp.]|nr:DUF6350 family protein [Pilimelia sp.]
MAEPRDDTAPAAEHPTVLLERAAGPAGRRPTAAVPTPRAQPARRRAPLLLAAAVAGAWAGVLSLLPAVLVAALADAGGFGPTARLGLTGWLLAHGVPARTSLGPFTLVPLGLAVLAAWRLERAGLHVVRAIGARRSASPARAAAAAGALAAVYGLAGCGAALAVGGGAVSWPRAAAVYAGFAALAGGVGALRATGLARRVARAAPAPVAVAARAGAVVALLLLAAGAAAAGVSLAVGASEASRVLSAYGTGVAGQVGLVALCAAYLPNVAVWATAYLLGPGFAVGAGTGVTVSDVSVGVLPAVPLAAALPREAALGMSLLVAVLPVVAGGCGGWLVARWAGGERREWARRLGAAALTGPVAGVLLAAAAWASGGALGGGRTGEFGPTAWQVGLVAAGGTTVGALVVAAVVTLLGRRVRPTP